MSYILASYIGLDAWGIWRPRNEMVGRGAVTVTMNLSWPSGYLRLSGFIEIKMVRSIGKRLIREVRPLVFIKGLVWGRMFG